MKTLYLDCFSGISGNMFIGMLIQAGVPFEEFQKAMAQLGLDGYSLICQPVNKLGIQSVYYNVLLDSEQDHHHHHDHEEGHDHHDHGQSVKTAASLIDATGHHHYHQHRGLAEITAIIEASPFTEAIKQKSLAVFQALAEAEAKVHGVPVSDIHFHEVGAIDCILDIVGTIWALDYLHIEQIGTSALHVGSGFVRCAHGIMPVPAPATAELLAGLPYYSTDGSRPGQDTGLLCRPAPGRTDPRNHGLRGRYQRPGYPQRPARLHRRMQEVLRREAQKGTRQHRPVYPHDTETD